jgi:hypothetical protein
MSRNTHYNITNEQQQLVNILNTMYNDNIRQINRITDSIYSLNESNRQISNLLIQILNNNNSTNNNSSNNNNINSNNNFNRRNYSRYSQRNNLRQNSRLPSANISTNANTGGLGRIYLNNRPYIIDSLQHYDIPLNRENTNNNNLSQILQNFFQPIEVFPTQSQIESATRNVRYCDIVSPRNRSCPISLENFNDTDTVSVIRFCGHIFNTEQLNTWFRSNCRCPVCRYDIRRYNSTASSEFFNSNESSGTNVNPITDQSIANPLNDTENVSSILNEERNRQTTSGRTSNALFFFNTILDNFSNANDINLSGIENIGGMFTDLSGNDTSNVIYNLLNEFNTRTTR